MNENREERKTCPCCGRHCDLNEPHCDRGREFLRTGVIPERRGGHDHNHDHDHSHGREHGCGDRSRRLEAYEAMDKDSKLIINLRDMGHTVRFLFEGKGSQRRILIILRESGTMTQRELTERLGIRPGSASEVIGKLESAGLIVRTPSETDHRTADISLTESGRKQAGEAAEQRQTRHQEMFSCLTEEEKDTLLALTEKLNEDWEKRYRETRKDSEYPDMQKRAHGGRDHHRHHGHERD